MYTKQLPIAAAISLSLFLANSPVQAEDGNSVETQNFTTTQTVSQSKESQSFTTTQTASQSSENTNANFSEEMTDPPKVQLYQFPSLTEAVAVPLPGKSLQIGGGLFVDSNDFIKVDGKDNTQFYTTVNTSPKNITNITSTTLSKSTTKTNQGIKSQFDDVPASYWAKNIIDSMALSNVVAGYPNHTFKPSLPILRSELASVLVSGMNLKGSAESTNILFKDVPDNDWAKSSIYKAVGAGIFVGYPDKTFKPENPASKSEVDTALAKSMPGTLSEAQKDAIIAQNKKIETLPEWAQDSAAEVVNADLKKDIPSSEMTGEKSVSRAAVVSMVYEMRKNLGLENTTCAINDSQCYPSPIQQVQLNVKAEDKISARTSNVGEKFYLKTLSPIELNGTNFPTGSIVKGEVMTVVRPCILNRGSIRIGFSEITSGDKKANLPEYIYSVNLEKSKNPNIIARTIAMPFTLAGRLIGITGRTVGIVPVITGNSVEEIGDDLGTSALELLSIKPVAATRSFGSSFVALGKGVFNIIRATVTGTAGLIIDTVDEAVYVVYPQGTNASSINPGEELGINFGIKQ